MAVGPRTRMDKVVWIRERTETAALKDLARARAESDRADHRVTEATQAARSDQRAAGPAELWQVDDAAHVRALVALRVARAEAERAQEQEASARDSYTAARQRVRTVRRVQERRRAEIAGEDRKRERRDLDEIATLRFNLPR